MTIYVELLCLILNLYGIIKRILKCFYLTALGHLGELFNAEDMRVELR